MSIFKIVEQYWGTIETSRRHYLVMAASITAIVSAGWVVYWNSLAVPFLFDDFVFIVEDYAIRMTEFTWPAIKTALFDCAQKYRFLPNLSFALNYYFGVFSVTGYHVVNIVIHILSGIFLFLFTSATLRIIKIYSNSNIYIAFFTALLWLVIPLHTQAVTYTCQRMTSMGAMFYIASLWLYASGRMAYQDVASRKSRGILFFIFSALAGFCALASKENTATLPVIILLYEWFFFQNLKIHLSKQKLIWLLLAGFIFCALVFYFTNGNPLHRILVAYTRRDFTLAERVMSEWRVIIYYISLLIFPLSDRLSLDHYYPLSQSFINPPTTIISIFAIGCLLFFAIKTARKERLTAFCILWFFFNLLIESTVIGIEIIYEHRTYLPSMMVSLLFVYWAFRFCRQKWVIAVCLSGLIFFFSIETIQRNNVWSDDLIFWNDNVKKSPNDPRAHNNLGSAIYRQGGDINKAIDHYKIAIQLDSTYVAPRFNWSKILIEKNELDPAIGRLKKCLQIKPDYYKAYMLLGMAYHQKGEIYKAIRYYNEALKINPLYAAAHYELAKAFIDLGETDKAMQILTFLLKSAPFSLAPHNEIAKILIRERKYNEAIAHLKQLLEVAPTHVEANINMGEALVHLKRLDQAEFYYQEAIRSDPSNEKAHYHLALLYQDMEEPGKAMDVFESLIRLNPENIDALFHLALLHDKLSQPDRSVEIFKRIISLQPDNPKPYYNIACIYSRTGYQAKALAWFQEAVGNGYDNWYHLTTDPDLAGIRNTPYLKDLLKKHASQEP